MASGSLGDPLLEQQQPQRGRTETIAGRVLAASSINYGRLRTIARLQSTKDGREENLLSRLAAPFVQVYSRFTQELNSLSLPFKAGLAASICALLCFAPGRLSVFNASGVGAVATVDMVLETNVGLTFSQGISLTLGTSAAVALALLVMFLSPMFGQYEPYFLVLCVFLGAALAIIFKSKLNVRWNLAVTISMVIFHVLILSKGTGKDKMMGLLILPVVMIVGVLVASLVNLSVAPKFSGPVINELVAKNLERAGSAIERSVRAYCEGKMLEQTLASKGGASLPEILAGNSEDENVHMSFHEIVSANSEVGTLLKAVTYEPCHGEFFFGYPWDLYEHITDNLRNALYDVVELDSCLHSEIQAPLHLRQIFEDEFLCIGEECAHVFRKLGESIRTMRPLRCRNPLEKAEEGALLLEHKIAKYTSSLFEGRGRAENEIARKDPDADKELDVIEEHVSVTFQEAIDDPTFVTAGAYLGTPHPNVERLDSNSSTEDTAAQCKTRSQTRSPLAERHQDFIHRRQSMSRQWETTVQRISALSLIKFAALLIEVVAKARYVVTIVEELETKARFGENEGNFTANIFKPGNQQA